MAILIACKDSSDWATGIRRAVPDLDVWTPDQVTDPGAVEYIVIWEAPSDGFAVYPNLKAILLNGAGFDHLDFESLPPVPIVRLVDPAMANDIALYVLSWVIHFQRDFDRFADGQRNGDWRHDLPVRFPNDVTVGVLGTGAIGRVVIETCASHGFATVGWSRSDHDRTLHRFFEDCDVVVNLLPLSDSTRALVASNELVALGSGVLINVGRAATVDHAALVDALDHDLRAVVLDVFDPEPLPAGSELWSHPKIVVTPHIAGRSNPVTAAPIIARNFEALLNGDVPEACISR